MNETHAGDVIRVDQVSVELPQLAGLELALVDQSPSRQRTDVEPVARHFEVQRVRHPLPQDVDLPLELLLRQGLVVGHDEGLQDLRLAPQRTRAEYVVVARHVAPADDGHVEVGGRSLEPLYSFRSFELALVQEEEAGRIFAQRWKLN